MTQKTIIFLFYFLNCYYNEAFLTKFTPTFFHKNNYCSLSNSNNDELDNNDLKIDTINKKIRLGRSKDQDGKSNIWSVEPNMEVVNEEITELNKNILTCGLIVTGFLTSLPLLYILNEHVQNINY